MDIPRIIEIDMGVPQANYGMNLFISHVVTFDDGCRIKVRESRKVRGKQMSRAEIAEMAIEYRRTRETMGGE